VHIEMANAPLKTIIPVRNIPISLWHCSLLDKGTQVLLSYE